jgi:hypothetical protein
VREERKSNGVSEENLLGEEEGYTSVPEDKGISSGPTHFGV